MSRIAKVLKKQSMLPGIFGLVVNPFYFARRGLADAIKSNSGYVSGRTLDVGCGSKPYEHLFVTSYYLGLDVDNDYSRSIALADLLYDGDRFPVKSGSIDSVICNQVLEHVPDPEALLLEVRRVLREDGNVMITVPFIWGEHMAPSDYLRYTSFGLKDFLEKKGFHIVKQEKIGCSNTVIFQLLNAYIFGLIEQLPIWLRYGFIFTICFAVNCLGVFFNSLLPKNDTLYLDNLVIAKKMR